MQNSYTNFKLPSAIVILVALISWFGPSANALAQARISSQVEPLPLAAASIPGLEPIPAAPGKTFVGRWDVIRSGAKSGSDVGGYMRFKDDGTFTSTVLMLVTTDGKYTVVSSKVIELDFPGGFWGRNKIEFIYQIVNDILTFKGNNNGVDLDFKRVDSGH